MASLQMPVEFRILTSAWNREKNRMRGVIFSTILLIGMYAVPLPAAVEQFRLDNGMQVIVKPDHRAPVVTSQVWYRIGSSYETDGITGVSHVLEHMMFRGTENVADGEFSRIIAALGGEENAFTGSDYTAYFENLSNIHLERALQLEADRMRYLRLNPAHFAKELEVVKEERRLRTEDQPGGMLQEQFEAVAYRASPYRNPVIGWMNDLQHLQAEDLEGWYRRWYAPNNAILVVAGDVDPQEVQRLAEKHFGPLAPSELAPAKPPAEPRQRGETRVEVRLPALQPELLMGYKTPVVGQAAAEWEPYALSVLASILDGGDSARLTRELVRRQELAVQASAGYELYGRLPGMLTISAVPRPGGDLAQLEHALRGEVARLRSEPVTAAELQRVINQAIAAKVYQRDSIFYQAMQIGMLEAVGLDSALLDQEVERLRSVTAEQIQAVAAKYLTDDNLTVALLRPLPMEGERGATAPAGGPHG